MGLKRVRCVAQVLAADQPHHRREQNEHALGPDFHLVVDACFLALGAEAEEVAALSRLDVRHESDSRVRLELLEFLDDFPDAAPLPIGPASSLREARTVGFQSAQLAPSATTAKTSSTGFLMN